MTKQECLARIRSLQVLMGKKSTTPYLKEVYREQISRLSHEVLRQAEQKRKKR
jgi:hypothetical protein